MNEHRLKTGEVSMLPKPQVCHLMWVITAFVTGLLASLNTQRHLTESFNLTRHI